MVPSRPKPQMTSSAISSTSCFLRTRLDLVEWARRRHQHAAGSHHRLGDEGGHGVRPFLLDQGIELFRAAARRGFLAFARLGVAIVVRTAGMHDAAIGEIKIAMIVRQPGQAGAGDGDAVMALMRETIFFLRGRPSALL